MVAIKNLRLVEVELFSYCNRRCTFCPNRYIDRHSECIEIEDDILEKILVDLKNNNYTNPITFSRYNEPLSKDELLKKRISQIKQFLPDNKLVTNTNGDFLKREVLENLKIDELTVMDYDSIGVDNCLYKLAKAGCEVTSVDYPYIYAKFNEMDILYFVDWTKHKIITDRGGFLKEFIGEARKRPCFEPTYFVGINYDGTVSPCCNIRNDIESHKQYILGDLHNSSLSDILSSYMAVDFRTQCSMGYFQKKSPCYTCENTGGRYTRGGSGIKYE